MPDSHLTAHLKRARRIMIFTGAGISTASGIPDFRGPGGVWTKRAPIYYDDFMSSERARIEHWDYKLEAWPAFKAARPNEVHQAIVDFEKAGKVLAVVTQNIDGLHTLAGTQSLVELHGTNALVECQTCLWRGDPNPITNFSAFTGNHRFAIAAVFLNRQRSALVKILILPIWNARPKLRAVATWW